METKLSFIKHAYDNMEEAKQASFGGCIVFDVVSKNIFVGGIAFGGMDADYSEDNVLTIFKNDGTEIVINIGKLIESGEYVSEDSLYEELKELLDVENKIGPEDSLGTAIHKVDEKGRIIANEISESETAIVEAFSKIEESVGLNDDLSFGPMRGEYIEGDTNVKDALGHLDTAVQNAGKVDDVYVDDVSVVNSDKIAALNTFGEGYDPEENPLVTADVVDVYHTSPTYGNTDDLDEETYYALNEENRIDSDDDWINDAVRKLDYKGKIILDEVLGNKESSNDKFEKIKNAVGLDDQLELGELEGEFIGDDTNVKDALEHLDTAIQNAGKVDDVTVNGNSVVDENKVANIVADGEYDPEENPLVTKNSIGKLEESPEYGDDTIDQDVYNSFNVTNKIDPENDDFATAIGKLDEKGKIIVNEIIKDENVTYEGFNAVRNSVGLNNRLELEGLEGEYIGDDTNVKDALEHLDIGIQNAGKVDDVHIGTTSVLGPDKIARIETTGTYDSELSRIVTKDTIGDLEESPVYGTSTMDSDIKTAFNTTNKIDPETDDFGDAISKLDNKGKIIVDEVIKDEKATAMIVEKIKESVGLNPSLEFDEFSGTYISDDTNVRDALVHLDEAVTDNDKVRDVKIDGVSIVGEKVADIATDGDYDAETNKLATEETVTVKNVKVNGTSILTDKEANIETAGEYNPSTNKFVTESVIGELAESPEYGDSDMDEDVYEALNSENKIDPETDDFGDAISKLDNKGKIIVDEILNNEETAHNTFIKIKNAVGLDDQFELGELEGEFIGDDTNVKDALEHLDEAVYANGKVDDVTLNDSSVLDGKTAKLLADGTYNPTSNKLATEETVTVKNVKVNGTSILTDKEANISVDGTYNSETNKVATVSSIKVDDVKVGGTSILDGKEANIATTGTYNATTGKVVTEDTVSPKFTNIQTSVGLNANLLLEALTGNYISGDTTIVAALQHLDTAIKSLGDLVSNWDEYED